MSDFSEPFETFGKWFAEASKAEPDQPNAVALATSTADGLPSMRMVLLKGWDQNGFVFYTNLESRKGGELKANPNVAMLFHWKSLARQIRIEGPVTQVSDAEADAYFATRARDSQIGAWASHQSRPMSGKLDLEKNVAKFAAKFGVSTVPRPPHWSGFRIVPRRMEFWSEGAFRLHKRVVYEKGNTGDWGVSRLFP